MCEPMWGTLHRMGVLRPNRRCPSLFAGMVLRSSAGHNPLARGYV